MVLKERCTIFISDLHIDADKPEITRQFIQFIQDLEASQGKLDALYILGDWFESWVGDDDPDSDKREAIAAVKSLSNAGTDCYFMAGNRDFMIGEQFASDSGCEILEDPTTIGLYGKKIVLMHGDTLCTDDIQYQEFRSMSRNPAWQQQVLSLPLEQRIAMAAQIREQSKIDTGNKSNDIMDVNKKAVLQAFAEHDTDIIIHGHTHRPAIHQFAKDTSDEPEFLTRIVLGDWYEQGSVLIWRKKDYELKTLAR
ncbi:MAG: UDP-2,3-diacylglucosamine diphosphatase [Gammaproteobacteria bacterium]|nr:UDP-2,3-diacylglucosamine diphosphatase [Gammaproteobacteria bacterium]